MERTIQHGAFSGCVNGKTSQKGEFGEWEHLLRIGE
jgi:hypothetical protein